VSLTEVSLRSVECRENFSKVLNLIGSWLGVRANLPPQTFSSPTPSPVSPMTPLWRHIADTNDILPPAEVTGNFLPCGVNMSLSSRQDRSCRLCVPTSEMIILFGPALVSPVHVVRDKVVTQRLRVSRLLSLCLSNLVCPFGSKHATSREIGLNRNQPWVTK
jgi:hypothetical protein